MGYAVKLQKGGDSITYAYNMTYNNSGEVLSWDNKGSALKLNKPLKPGYYKNIIFSSSYGGNMTLNGDTVPITVFNNSYTGRAGYTIIDNYQYNGNYNIVCGYPYYAVLFDNKLQHSCWL